jgi:hypothetical protein
MRIVVQLPPGVPIAYSIGDVIPMMDDEEPADAPPRWGWIVGWNEREMTIELLSSVTCDQINRLEILWNLS